MCCEEHTGGEQASLKKETPWINEEITPEI